MGRSLDRVSGIGVPPHGDGAETRTGRLRRIIVTRTPPTRTPPGVFFVRHLPLYLDYLAVEKGLAKNSLEGYRRDLSAFGAPRREGLSTGDAGREDVVAWLGGRRAEGASPRTLARATSALRGFYRFLSAEKGLPADPTADLSNPRRWSMLPKFLSPEDVQKLLDAPDVETPKGPARPGDVRAPLRLRPPRLRARVPPSRASASRTASSSCGARGRRNGSSRSPTPRPAGWRGGPRARGPQDAGPAPAGSSRAPAAGPSRARPSSWR